MNIITLDFESFFTDAKDARGRPYTLSHLTTEDYIRHPWFQAHGCAIKWCMDKPPCGIAKGETGWYDRKGVYGNKSAVLPSCSIFDCIDWDSTACISHHAQFDMAILNWHFGKRPKFIFDTLSMARLLLGNHLSVSLDAVRKHFGIPLKSTPYNLFKNKHWHELTPAVQNLVADGACDEVESIWKIFQLLGKDFPREEYEVIDSTIRMFTEPQLCGDIDLLGKVWEKESTNKVDRYAALGISEADVQSSNKFADLLRAAGVEPAVKDGKNGDIYAFAKSDQFMRDLLEHDDERVRMLAEARVGAKSTLQQTRAETLGWMARRGAMPVYLRYCGAHTTRWSGGDGCLTADTIVICFDFEKGFTEKRIVDVLPDDLVWDGEEFVHHKGVVFQGSREVVEHDSIRGTLDHKVYDAGGNTISLAEAARTRTKIMDCPAPTRGQMESVARGRYPARVVSLQMWKASKRTAARPKK